MIEINVDKILKDKVLSVRWLSKQTGITYSNLYGFCKNRKKMVRLDYLERICDVLKVTLDDIVTFKK